jgi:hypothetical protein
MVARKRAPTNKQEEIVIMRIAAVAITLVLVVSGCAARDPRLVNLQLYEGPPRAGEEVALLVVAADTELVAVDGVRDIGGKHRKALDHQGEIRYALLPGPHTVAVRKVAAVSSMVEASFQAEAGGRYRVRTYSPTSVEGGPFIPTIYSLRAIVDDYTDRPMWWCENGYKCREMQFSEVVNVDLTGAVAPVATPSGPSP